MGAKNKFPPKNRTDRPPLDDEARDRIDRIKRERAFADEISDALGETQEKPRNQIRNVVRYCGIEFTQAIYDDMLEIEANGGMLVLTGERRRTQGGVFFQLVRERVDQDTRERIFVYWVYSQKQFVSKESIYEPFIYAERAQVLMRLLADPGEVEEVNITLIGRYKEIERRQALVIVAMRATVADGFTMPAGVPIPPKETDFVVYISIRQWEKAEPILQADETDLLMVTGFCAYDEEMKALAVYTTHASTRKTYKTEQFQMRQREQQNQQAQTPAPKKAPKAGGKGGNAPQSSAPPKKSGKGSAPKDNFVDENTAPRPAPIPSENELVDGLPSAIAETLRKLYSAASTYRQKIEDIKAKPESQQFGLEMTEKLLVSTEKQIASLEKQYKK
ncbi:MAG: phosphorylated adapter RNA export RNA-binding domain-containing protein [bacterium]|nr:phosphorylated adapter RNA export RNA-binding domain-containing protein [bacterium]